LGMGKRYRSSNRTAGPEDATGADDDDDGDGDGDVATSGGLRCGRLRVTFPAPSSLRATDIDYSSRMVLNVNDFGLESALAGIRRSFLQANYFLSGRIRSPQRP
jgi:hypothetical protein